MGSTSPDSHWALGPAGECLSHWGYEPLGGLMNYQYLMKRLWMRLPWTIVVVGNKTGIWSGSPNKNSETPIPKAPQYILARFLGGGSNIAGGRDSKWIWMEISPVTRHVNHGNLCATQHNLMIYMKNKYKHIKMMAIQNQQKVSNPLDQTSQDSPNKQVVGSWSTHENLAIMKSSWGYPPTEIGNQTHQQAGSLADYTPCKVGKGWKRHCDWGKWCHLFGRELDIFVPSTTKSNGYRSNLEYPASKLGQNRKHSE